MVGRHQPSEVRHGSRRQCHVYDCSAAAACVHIGNTPRPYGDHRCRRRPSIAPPAYVPWVSVADFAIWRKYVVCIHALSAWRERAPDRARPGRARTGSAACSQGYKRRRLISCDVEAVMANGVGAASHICMYIKT